MDNDWDMDARFLPHNSHLKSLSQFGDQDPQLSRLKSQTYVFHPPLLERLPVDAAGIYTLGGGRQIGKTTLLKQWMHQLVEQGVRAEAIFFFSGELIDDHHSLLRLLESQLAQMPTASMRYVLVDEVSYIKDWDKAVKYAADSGALENVVLMLTGSDLTFIREARMRFPGRRGKADETNFHLYPISFREYVQLVSARKFWKGLDDMMPAEESMRELFAYFDRYLMHGGYLTAINDLAGSGQISKATLETYSDWIRGDMLKRGKNERYLREIIAALIKSYNKQITWNSLADDLSIDHPATVSDYATLLESMDAIFIQHALLEDKLQGAPKKARKVIFTDPFIYHAMRAWLRPSVNPHKEQIASAISDPEIASALCEACVSAHFRRNYPTYYIKAEGEVDVAYINHDRFWPIEIKWTNRMRAKDAKQIQKYQNGRIWAKVMHSSTLEHLQVEPLPYALYRIDQ